MAGPRRTTIRRGRAAELESAEGVKAHRAAVLDNVPLLEARAQPVMVSEYRLAADPGFMVQNTQ